MGMRLLVTLVLGLSLAGVGGCGRPGDDLSAADAADQLRTATGFTTREGTLVGRQLLEVLAVRRIGQSSTEVEFTWRDFPLPPGAVSTVRTSAALFRRQSGGPWRLQSLYKVD